MKGIPYISKYLSRLSAEFVITTIVAVWMVVLAFAHEDDTLGLGLLGEVVTALTWALFYPAIALTGSGNFFVRFTVGVAIYSLIIFAIIEVYRDVWKRVGR